MAAPIVVRISKCRFLLSNVNSPSLSGSGLKLIRDSSCRTSFLRKQIQVLGARFLSNDALPLTVDSGQQRQSPLLTKRLPASKLEALKIVKQKPDQPANAKILKVAVIGSPNAGKSTLTNALLKWKVSSVSSKVHTTRAKINAVLTENDTQIVFLDTPGVIHPSKIKRHSLEKSLLVDPHYTIKQADLIAVVVDVSETWNRSALDPLVLQLLHVNSKIPSVLVLNKVDLMTKKSTLLWTTKVLTDNVVDGRKNSYVKSKAEKTPKANLIMQNYESSSEEIESRTIETLGDSERKNNELIQQICEEANLKDSWQEYYQVIRRLDQLLQMKRGWPNFQQVFMISSKEQDGVEDFKEYLLSCSKPGDWLYHSSLLTDQDPWEIAKQSVLEKLLDHLPQEVPYNIDLDIIYWSEDDELLSIVMELICRTSHHMRLCLGKQGGTVRQICKEAKQAVMDAFQRELKMKLVVRLKPAKVKRRK
ncbi:GTPase Era, mitochondrial-like [Tubulanus polymorphus]|uniref:GTPase Era, mitochondrial-like n=1 Tax=Tubulanus polymorphus TaxID=672921 RepID=UPI003DA5710B